MRDAAKERVKEQTGTSGVRPEILHAEIAVDNDGNGFRDHKVHSILLASGIERRSPNKGAREWFKTDLETIKAAIRAAKAGENFIESKNISVKKSPIEFREEQRRAIDNTVKHFRKNKSRRFLWDAKMRFGKTLCALQVIKEMKFVRTIIVTHRPVVRDGWRKDFAKIFYESSTPYILGGRSSGAAGTTRTFEELEKAARSGKKYVYFASIQDLRGSEKIAGASGFDKNQAVFRAAWDLVIIDEAHEGAQTDLGKKVLTALTHAKTCVLSLSGTPFNFIEKFDPHEIFTWNYIDEQRAKREFAKKHPGEPNPYADLPEMHIRTYALGNALENPEFLEVEDRSFSFSTFFRVGEDEKFVYEKAVKTFLDLLVGKHPDTQYYPFANEKFRSYFRHSFWILPGIKEARALEKLLKNHDVFGSGFEIVNVAGEGNAKDNDKEEEEEEYKANCDALDRVKKAIEKREYTITLSCGRLTTGVTIPEWTAVLYLAGGYKTSPASYLQTIFRVQSPGSVDGRVKEKCYAFDFAPDRTIATLDQVAQCSAGSDKKIADREALVKKFIEEFTEFAPLISFSGSETKRIDTEYVLKKIYDICITQVVRSGFANPRIFNNKLWNLTNEDVDMFKRLEGKIGKHTQVKEKEVVINDTGLSESETTTHVEYLNLPPAKTDREEASRRKKREKVIAVLLNATVRVPLLVFGAKGDVDASFTSENFADCFDDESWREFMGSLTKEDFRQYVAPYLRETVFSGACSRIRERVAAADKLPVRERMEKIIAIHGEFKNPDKETVLTPWRVVNMQLSETLGGYKFSETDPGAPPEFVDRGNATRETLDSPRTRILEINSKTGLYPLYLAYSLMRAKLSPRSKEKEWSAWKSAVARNIFVVCRTKMAAAITRRTLLGFDENAKANIIVRENLPERIQDDFPRIVNEIKNPKTWGYSTLDSSMEFNAIVGNPPYQEDDGGNQASASPVYHHFVHLAKALDPKYITLIMPARWYSGGKGLSDFREEMLNDKRIRMLTDFFDATECFPNAEIKGGVCYFLRNRDEEGVCEITTFLRFLDGKVLRTKASRPLLLKDFDSFIRFNDAIGIIKKLHRADSEFFEKFISARKPFGLGTSAVGKEKSSTRTVKFYANKKKSADVGYLSEKEIPEGKDLIHKHKILISRAYGAGNTFPHQILNTPFYAPPNSACSETYLVVGPFENKEICENVISYMHTKFFRFLVLQKKNTQDATRNVYSLVPVQDFSKPWTDEKLYAKYNLSKKEIEFVEEMIRPMP